MNNNLDIKGNCNTRVKKVYDLLSAVKNNDFSEVEYFMQVEDLTAPHD